MEGGARLLGEGTGRGGQTILVEVAQGAFLVVSVASTDVCFFFTQNAKGRTATVTLIYVCVLVLFFVIMYFFRC